MGINEGAVRQLAVGSQYSSRQPRQNLWGLVIQVDGVTEVPSLKITIIVFGRKQVRGDHHCLISTDSSLDDFL